MAPAPEGFIKRDVGVTGNGHSSGSLDEYESDPRHTQYDQSDMNRLGKKQEFKRVFGFWPTFGFTSIYLATWEYILVSVYQGLVNGGFGGLVYEAIGTFICFFTVVASLAEIESMAPTSGGNYHWVSEFAPPSVQKYLSYATGWLSALGWLCGNASGTYIMGTLLESLIEVYIPDFAFKPWQFTLLTIAFMLLAVLFNTYLARFLPGLETASLILHSAGFFIIIIPLWILAPKNPASDVFGEVTNKGGWSTVGASCLVGHVSILYCTLGPDVAVHISEEVRDAARVIPVCMLWSYVLNAVMGMVMLITMLFTVGPLHSALNAASPFVNSFANTKSQGLAFALTTILAVLIFAGNVTSVATTSREVWAFGGRDGGFPGHRFLAKVSHRYNIPMNSVYITAFLSIVLLLINLGSNLAFNIIISLNLVAFLAAYGLSIGCVLLKRLRHEPLPPARWSLGRLGLPLNAFAVVYCGFALVMSCFPISIPVTPKTANWAPAIFGGVILVAIASYGLYNRKIYEGPVIYVEGRRKAGVGFQRT